MKSRIPFFGQPESCGCPFSGILKVSVQSYFHTMYGIPTFTIVNQPSVDIPYMLGGGFKYFNFHPYLGKIPILTKIFERG